MKYVTIGELYDLKETIARELFEGKTYPWVFWLVIIWSNILINM